MPQMPLSEGGDSLCKWKAGLAPFAGETPAAQLKCLRKRLEFSRSKSLIFRIYYFILIRAIDFGIFSSFMLIFG